MCLSVYLSVYLNQVSKKEDVYIDRPPPHKQDEV